jgi:hypothetical protein
MGYKGSWTYVCYSKRDGPYVAPVDGVPYDVASKCPVIVPDDVTKTGLRRLYELSSRGFQPSDLTPSTSQQTRENQLIEEFRVNGVYNCVVEVGSTLRYQFGLTSFEGPS